jgi:ABC-type transporter Mla subunit MlaD
MASIKEVGKVFDDLENLVKELRNELSDGPDFEKLVQIADEISEHADNAAQTFNSVNEALMSRLNEVRGTKKSSSGSQSKEKSQSQTASASSS